MKHGKKLTRQMKNLLVREGLDPDEWLYIKDTVTELWIHHKSDPGIVKMINI